MTLPSIYSDFDERDALLNVQRDASILHDRAEAFLSDINFALSVGDMYWSESDEIYEIRARMEELMHVCKKVRKECIVRRAEHASTDL